MTTGLIIKLLRHRKGITQEVLASELGVSRAYLSQVENERKSPSLAFFRKVSTSLGVPLALLIAWEGGSAREQQIQATMSEIFSDLLSAKLKSEPDQQKAN